MKNIKIIKIIYLGYGIFFLMTYLITNMSIDILLFSWIALFICYCPFALGYYSRAGNNRCEIIIETSDNNIESKTFIPVFLSILVFAFAIVNARYYTGQTPISLLSAIRSHVSVYYSYQQYASEKSFATISIFKKLPYIFTQFYNAMMLFYMMPRIINGGGKKWVKAFCSIMITLGIAYFGLARGTTYEFLQIGIVWIYIILNKYSSRLLSAQNIRKIVITIIIGIFAINMFFSNVSSRGVNINVIEFPNIDFDDTKIVSKLFPGIALIISRLYGYFGFGQFYCGYFLSRVCFESPGRFIGLLLPGGLNYLGGMKSIHTEMDRLIDVGVKWHPDFALFLYSYGLITFLMGLFIVGRVSKRCDTSGRYQNNGNFIQIIILLQMISFPIGNFLSLAGYMQMVTIAAFILYFKEFPSLAKLRIHVRA